MMWKRNLVLRNYTLNAQVQPVISVLSKIVEDDVITSRKYTLKPDISGIMWQTTWADTPLPNSCENIMEMTNTGSCTVKQMPYAKLWVEASETGLVECTETCFGLNSTRSTSELEQEKWPHTK